MARRIKNEGLFITQQDYERLIEYECELGKGYLLPLKIAKRMPTKNDLADIIECLKRGETQFDIARKYKTSYYKLRKYLHNNGIRSINNKYVGLDQHQ